MHAHHTSHSARHETLGATSAASNGVWLTASATVHVKGAWESVGGATSFAYESLTFVFSGATTNNFNQVDIGITVGAETYVIVPDITTDPRAAGDAGTTLTLPIHVPAGSQLAARLRSSSSSGILNVLIIGSSSGLMGTPGVSRAVKLFTDSTSSSAGISIDIGSTVVNTKMTDYTTLIASSPERVCGIFGIPDSAGDATKTAIRWLLDLAIGSSGSELDIVTNMMFGADSVSDTPTPKSFGPFLFDVSSGTRFSARAQNNTGISGDRVIGISLYGLVP